MRIVKGLCQNTPQWDTFRRNHLTASESASIMGFNRFRTAKSVWEEKVLGWQQEFDQAAIDRMAEGQRMEPIARQAYQDLTGIQVEPMVIESSEWPFLSCSLDGMTKTLDRACEIKCGASSHKSAREELIPAYYLCQIAHQQLVTGLHSIDYFSYYKGEGILLTVNRDEELIKELLEKEIEFWHNVQAGTPPKD